MVRPHVYAAQALRGWGNRRALRALRTALAEPAAVQSAVLARMLERNAGCEFGRRHGLARVRTVADYRAAVPVRDYGDHAGDIGRIMAGEQGILTCEPVRMVERTSGSTGAAKFIPYTDSLRREFGEAIAAWVGDLHAQRPALLGGREYWSVTPAVRERERTVGGLPIGFDSDTDYLGPVERLLMRMVLAGGADIVRTDTLDGALAKTAVQLARCRSLRFISVWNPSFLSLLVDRLAPRHPQEVWPELKLISCWTDASAALALPALRRRFPAVEIQGKGLLSTEGVVSLPLLGIAGAVPALRSHFLEFLPEGDIRHPRLAHELEPGLEYAVVITTGGGLWRYRTGDRVRVAERVQATPTLVFVGRENGVADLCGEKLAEAFVADVLARTVAPRVRAGAFLMLAPEIEEGTAYVLYTDDESAVSEAAGLDAALRANPHYDYCRNLGQLAPVRVVATGAGAFSAYLQHEVRRGLRAGDVKPTALYPRPGLHRAFTEGGR